MESIIRLNILRLIRGIGKNIRPLAQNPRQIHLKPSQNPETLWCLLKVTSKDLILFFAVAADFHVGELRDEVDILLAVGAVEALVGARLGVQHRLDQPGVRADLQRGEKRERSSCTQYVAVLCCRRTQFTRTL